MGISNFGELICAIISIMAIFFLYCLLGYAFCPDSLKVQWIRALYILFWPIVIVLTLLSFPFIMIYEFSKPPEVQEKELNEFMKEYK
jgi:hypothetical protein